MFWKKKIERKESIDYSNIFSLAPRRPLFAKLELLVSQAEEHYGRDNELCKDILALIPKTIDKHSFEELRGKSFMEEAIEKTQKQE